MPRLEWDGKKAVENYHLQVPYHVLREEAELSAGGEAGARNLLVQGDNLVALKALLPYYRGQVKCIYIDPPYNTGNEGWVYNDNVNSPIIKEWLNKSVGKEAEDFSRHDKWLCMMLPRLKLLREFLSDDGSIWISIDDNEVASLRLLMDEIFGKQNFVAQVEWQKRYTRSNNTVGFTTVVEHIVIYQKTDSFSPNLVPKGEEAEARYTNPDNDPRGPWKAIPFLNPLSPKERPNLCYNIVQPNTGEILKPERKAWRTSQDTFLEYTRENKIYWGSNGKSRTPTIKRFLSEVRTGMPPINFWDYQYAGHTDIANAEIKELFTDKIFDTPKPTLLIQRILETAAQADSIILDSFAGSGTTGHAILRMNSQDGGNRRFILVEMEGKVAREVTAKRMKRVSEGYKKADDSNVPGLGGGFRFLTLGEPIFDADGTINPAITFQQLARHVWFEETRDPLPADATLNSPFLGVSRSGLGVYLLFNGILKDRRINGGNILTLRLLATLPPHAGPKVVYAAGCRLDAARLREDGITFKQTPYQITGAAASADALAERTENSAP